MNINEYDMFDSAWIFILMVVIGIIIFSAWISTKVQCDFRNARTIIVQASNHRTPTYTRRSLFQFEELNILNRRQHNYLLSQNCASISDENLSQSPPNEMTFEETNNKDSYDVPSSSMSNNLTINRGSFYRYQKTQLIKIRIKYLNDCEKLVYGNFKQTISVFKRDNFLNEQSQNLCVRLIYNGQELKEDGKTLEQYGLRNNCTIHCLITQRRNQISIHSSHQSSVNGFNSDRSDIEIGNLMIPLLGALLIVIWYCRICYRHYFNVITTFALIGMTIIYFIACITYFNFGNSLYSINNHPIQRSHTNQSTGISTLDNSRFSPASTFSSF